MSKDLMIAGNSGSGKTTSFRNLDPATTFIVNCGKKDLPFPKARLNYKPFDKASGTGNMINTNVFEHVHQIMPLVSNKLPYIKTLIIDDVQFAMAASVMKNIAIKGFDKWNELAHGIWLMAEAAKAQRDDLTVVFIEHLDVNYDQDGVKNTKAKTVGKLIDNVINLDGLFTTILYSEIGRNETGGLDYLFRTRSNGGDTCKSPMGMFEDTHIPNDLNYVLDRMNEYYGVDSEIAIK